MEPLPHLVHEVVRQRGRRLDEAHAQLARRLQAAGGWVGGSRRGVGHAREQAAWSDVLAVAQRHREGADRAVAGQGRQSLRRRCTHPEVPQSPDLTTANLANHPRSNPLRRRDARRFWRDDSLGMCACGELLTTAGQARSQLFVPAHLCKCRHFEPMFSSPYSRTVLLIFTPGGNKQL